MRLEVVDRVRECEREEGGVSAYSASGRRGRGTRVSAAATSQVAITAGRVSNGR